MNTPNATDQTVQALNDCQGRLQPSAYKVALSLLTWHKKRGVWTPRQRDLAVKLVNEVHEADRKKTPMVTDVTPLINILVSSNMAAPAIRVIKGDKTYRLKLDKCNSSIKITCNGAWAGQLTSDGCYIPPKRVELTDTNRVFDDLMHVLMDPIGYARNYGTITGHCSFCALPLTDPRSQAAGYGEICASRYRLAWG